MINDSEIPFDLIEKYIKLLIDTDSNMFNLYVYDYLFAYNYNHIILNIYIELLCKYEKNNIILFLSNILFKNNKYCIYDDYYFTKYEFNRINDCYCDTFYFTVF